MEISYTWRKQCCLKLLSPADTGNISSSIWPRLNIAFRHINKEISEGTTYGSMRFTHFNLPKVWQSHLWMGKQNSWGLQGWLGYPSHFDQSRKLECNFLVVALPLVPGPWPDWLELHNPLCLWASLHWHVRSTMVCIRPGCMNCIYSYFL